MFDYYLTRLIIESRLLTHNVHIEDIRKMSEDEVMKYFWVLTELDIKLNTPPKQ